MKTTCSPARPQLSQARVFATLLKKRICRGAELDPEPGSDGLMEDSLKWAIEVIAGLGYLGNFSSTSFEELSREGGMRSA